MKIGYRNVYSKNIFTSCESIYCAYKQINFCKAYQSVVLTIAGHPMDARRLDTRLLTEKKSAA